MSKSKSVKYVLVDGNGIEQAKFASMWDAYAALEDLVGGDDFTTSLSCDGMKVYGFPTEEDERASAGADCAYTPYISEID